VDRIPRDIGEKRKTGRDPNECPSCHGYGTTTNTETSIVNLKTEKQGSGCPQCHGTGRVAA
jgi:DnaJ-class molecular chaperone